jgi:hypothetical protein
MRFSFPGNAEKNAKTATKQALVYFLPGVLPEPEAGSPAAA